MESGQKCSHIFTVNTRKNNWNIQSPWEANKNAPLVCLLCASGETVTFGWMYLPSRRLDLWLCFSFYFYLFIFPFEIFYCLCCCHCPAFSPFTPSLPNPPHFPNRSPHCCPYPWALFLLSHTLCTLTAHPPTSSLCIWLF